MKNSARLNGAFLYHKYMKRFALHIFIALLTFLIGVSAETAYNYDYYKEKSLEWQPRPYCCADPPAQVISCTCECAVDPPPEPKKQRRARRK